MIAIAYNETYLFYFYQYNIHADIILEFQLIFILILLVVLQTYCSATHPALHTVHMKLHLSSNTIKASS